jgi:uncharacterized protein
LPISRASVASRRSPRIFPDFLVAHRTDPTQRALVELVGFYTPEYLARKLALLRDPRLARVVFCIDESLGMADGELPRDARIVRFKKRVPVQAVITAIARLPRGTPMR